MKKLIALVLLCNTLTVTSAFGLPIGHGPHIKVVFKKQTASPKEIAIGVTSTVALASLGIMTISTIDGFCNLCRAIGNLENEVKRSLYFRNLAEDIQLFISSAATTYISIFLLAALIDRK